ncbi:unnamed protein product [Euphydryas editha]|uniref:Uncharacterized protein n=1 Tax=Euphydryas editha TaxID=104508 RepID=A0AAU9TGH8_EUPED|nr:unnamed protein product [Euphydryas editha]
MTNLLAAPEKLDLEGDNATVALRWEQWKRSFNIYLEATGITGEGKKRATLLLLGGPGLQEIVYNLPGAYEENSTNESQAFNTVIEKLDEYFLPKQNKIYERHLFRQIKQDEGEKFEKFVVKLRDQARKCKFNSPDEHIIDQIVEKCFSSELRKKILTLGDTVTLDKIITEANTLELVSHQLEEYGKKRKSNEVNTIRSHKKVYNTEKSYTKHNNKNDKTGESTRKYHLHIASDLMTTKDASGKSYLALKSLKIKSVPLTPTHFDFKNMFNGHQEKSDEFHKLLHENWKEISETFDSPIFYTCVGKVLNNLNKYFQNVPLDNFILL